ncbi:putative Ig domain-containing protein [Jeotgalicoccus halotolerans]|uniref:putative Ig domain-containing protein n=1 Tax=Jeotgalicoccus halotolerans TaxID=157227 RepID=UPI003517B939
MKYKKNRNEQYLNNKVNKYSIRKLKAGAAAVMIGSFLFFGVSELSEAAEVETAEDEVVDEEAAVSEESAETPDETEVETEPAEEPPAETSETVTEEAVEPAEETPIEDDSTIEIEEAELANDKINAKQTIDQLVNLTNDVKSSYKIQIEMAADSATVYSIAASAQNENMQAAQVEAEERAQAEAEEKAEETVEEESEVAIQAEVEEPAQEESEEVTQEKPEEADSESEKEETVEEESEVAIQAEAEEPTQEESEEIIQEKPEETDSKAEKKEEEIVEEESEGVPQAEAEEPAQEESKEVNQEKAEETDNRSEKITGEVYQNVSKNTVITTEVVDEKEHTNIQQEVEKAYTESTNEDQLIDALTEVVNDTFPSNINRDFVKKLDKNVQDISASEFTALLYRNVSENVESQTKEAILNEVSKSSFKMTTFAASSTSELASELPVAQLQSTRDITIMYYLENDEKEGYLSRIKEAKNHEELLSILTEAKTLNEQRAPSDDIIYGQYPSENTESMLSLPTMKNYTFQTLTFDSEQLSEILDLNYIPFELHSYMVGANSLSRYKIDLQLDERIAQHVSEIQSVPHGRNDADVRTYKRLEDAYGNLRNVWEVNYIRAENGLFPGAEILAPKTSSGGRIMLDDTIGNILGYYNDLDTNKLNYSIAVRNDVNNSLVETTVSSGYFMTPQDREIDLTVSPNQSNFFRGSQMKVNYQSPEATNTSSGVIAVNQELVKQGVNSYNRLNGWTYNFEVDQRLLPYIESAELHLHDFKGLSGFDYSFNQANQKAELILDENGRGSITASNLNDLIEFNNVLPETVGVRVVYKLVKNIDHIFKEDVIGQNQSGDYFFNGYFTDPSNRLINNSFASGIYTLQDTDIDGIVDDFEVNVSGTDKLVAPPLSPDIYDIDVLVNGVVDIDYNTSGQTIRIVNTLTGEVLADGVVVDNVLRIHEDNNLETHEFNVSILPQDAGTTLRVEVLSPNFNAPEVTTLNVLESPKAVNQITLNIGETVNPETVISNFENMPVDAVYEWITPPQNVVAGTSESVVRVTIGNRAFDLIVPVNVIDEVSPVIEANNFVAVEGAPISPQPISVVDNTNEVIVPELLGLPDGLSFNAETGNIEGTVAKDALNWGDTEEFRDFEITITATDESDNTSTETVIITVQRDTDGDGGPDVTDPDDDNDGFTDEEEIAAGTDPKDPADYPDNVSPGITPIDDQTVVEGDSITPIVIEVDEPSTITVNGLPEGVTVDPDTNEISGSPIVEWNGDEEVREIEVTVTATDESDNSSTETVVISVQRDTDGDGDPDVTDPDDDNDGFTDEEEIAAGTDPKDPADQPDVTNPEITPIDDQTIVEGNSIAPILVETDEPVTIDVSELPEGVIFKSDTNEITGTPVVEWNGDEETRDFEVTITATDEADNSSTETVTITVQRDTDGDGDPDVTDPDDDNDGFTDEEEIAAGTDPKDPADQPDVTNPEITPIDDQTVVEGNPITPILVEVDEPVTIDVSELSEGVIFNSDTNEINGTPVIEWNGDEEAREIEVTVTATDESGNSSEETFVIVVQRDTDGDGDPDVTDPDDDNDGFTDEEEIAAGTNPKDPADQPDVTNPGITPIDDQTIVEGNSISPIVIEVDEPSTITVEGLPEGVVFNPDKNEITGTPVVEWDGDEEVKDFEIVIKATDESGNESTETVVITVQRDTDGDGDPDVTDPDDDNDGFTDEEEIAAGTNPKDPTDQPDVTNPVITPIDDQTIVEGNSIAPIVIEVDEPATIDLSELPEGLVFNPDTNEITGTPVIEWNGDEEVKDFEIVIKATDESGNESTETVVITVQRDTDGDGDPDFTDPDDENDGFTDEEEIVAGTDPKDPTDQPDVTAPVITPINDQTIVEGTPVTPVVIEVDEPVTVDVSELPEGLVFNPDTNEITGTPVVEWDGDEEVREIEVTVTATDESSNSSEETFVIVVQRDTDGDGDPDVTDPDDDNDGFTDEEEIAAGTNPKDLTDQPDVTAPVITPINDQTIVEGNSIAPIVIEVDEPVTIDVPELPEGLVFNPDTNEITGTPIIDWEGNEEVRDIEIVITVTDESGNTSTETVVVSVQRDTDGDGDPDVTDPDDDNDGFTDEEEIAAGTDPKDPTNQPDVTNPVITPIEDQTIVEGTPITPIVIEADEPVTVDVSELPDGIVFHPDTNEITGTPIIDWDRNEEIHDIEIVITVTDNSGNTTTETVVISVQRDTDGDGDPDVTDPDDDNDGFTDEQEIAAGTDPKDSNYYPESEDNDSDAGTIINQDDNHIDSPAVNPVGTDNHAVTGHGDPGETIIVTLPSGENLQTTVNDQGDWMVYLPDKVQLHAGDIITAVAVDADGTTSIRSSVIVGEKQQITGTGMNAQDDSTAEKLPDTGEANSNTTRIFGSFFLALGSLLLFKRRKRKDEEETE